MKVVLINGSPRKKWNTHKLLLEAEKGAKGAGTDTEIIHLFDLDYTDCKSCFACRLRGNKTERYTKKWYAEHKKRMIEEGYAFTSSDGQHADGCI